MKDIKLSQPNTNQRISPKPAFYLICIGTLFFAGCFQYQYVSVESNLNRNENKEFVQENDTVIMNYDFTGMDFPMTITVFNKLQQPLYFDLGKSTVIMNDIQIDGAFDREDQVDSIAPRSYATIKSNNLSNKFIPLSSQDKKDNVVIPTANGNRHIKLHLFNQETSPVLFRSVLAISTQKDLSSTMFYDHSFWVSGIFQAFDVTPSNSPSNQFYMQKTTGFTKFMGYTGGMILIIAIAAITPPQ